MSFKIGFEVEPAGKTPPVTNNPARGAEPRRCLAEVYFSERERSYTYYNDRFDLQVGDLVFVEGKLEGVRGRVVGVNYTFKIKLVDYKRVIHQADTRVRGTLTMADDHFITVDPETLSFEQVQGWLMPPSEPAEVVVGSGDNPFPLNNLAESGISQESAERGHEYYVRGRVSCIEKIGDRCRALVMGSEIYTVEFTLQNGMVSDLVCDCYCPGRCKHQMAALLQLRESLELAERNGLDTEDYLLAVNQHLFYEMVVCGRRTGTIRIG